MQIIIVALIAYVGWGTSDIFGTIATRRIGAIAATFWATLVAFILCSFYAPFVISQLKHIPWYILLISLTLAIIWTISLFCFNRALTIANPAIVGAIGLSWGVVTVITSTVFLGERIHTIQILTMILIFVGIVLSSVDIFELFRSKKMLFQRGVMFALVAMVGWGVYGAFLKVPVRSIGWFWPQYITYGITPLIIFCYLKLKRIKLHPPVYNHAFVPLFASTILTRSAEFLYNIGASQGEVAIIAPIAGSYSTLFVVLAFLIFREPITKQQICGVMLTVAGIVCLSFLSV